ncbi:prephenate dehydrogenase [Antrihabitans sp. YC2-6]|nr:prephenate dehydrogenase [Antrihabitans sp. YC2-6]
MGQLLVPLWRATGRRVVVIDQQPADAADYVCADIREPTAAVVAALQDSALVALALPEEVAVAVAADVAGLLAPDALLLETLSVKTDIHERLAGATVASVGINPMFAPSLGFADRPVGVVVHRDGPAVDEVRKTLRDWGARIVELSADEHDRRCAATQALTHAAVLTFGLALANLEVAGSELVPIATPPHNVMLALLARVSGGAPEVYLDIQAGNPYARDARKALASAISELTDVVDTGGDFAELMVRAAKPLDGHVDNYQELCRRLIQVIR